MVVPQATAYPLNITKPRPYNPAGGLNVPQASIVTFLSAPAPKRLPVNLLLSGSTVQYISFSSSIAP